MKIEINKKMKQVRKHLVGKKKKFLRANVDTETAITDIWEIHNEILHIKTMEKGPKPYSEEILTLSNFVIKQ